MRIRHLKYPALEQLFNNRLRSQSSMLLNGEKVSRKTGVHATKTKIWGARSRNP